MSAVLKYLQFAVHLDILSLSAYAEGSSMTSFAAGTLLVAAYCDPFL
jgi:hypothetical protein